MYRNQTFTFGDFALNGLHLALREAVRFASYEKRMRLARVLGRHTLGSIPSFQHRIADNLELIFPSHGENWRARIQQECAENIGQSLMEHMNMPDFRDRIGNLDIRGDAVAGIGAGSHAILITGHFAQWEAIRVAWRMLTGAPCGFLFRPNNNGFFDRHWQRYLDQAGSPNFAKGGAGRDAMLAHLEAGGSVLFANDQHQSQADYFDFLGHPARTATSAARLSLDYGCPLIPAYAIRRETMIDYDVVFEAPIAKGTPEEMTQAANDSLSARVKEHPELYYWAHRRWR